ncbi:MAG: SLBB domain-containing protein [Flavobacterium sp.]|nr:SLBB domain-containing protein [Flavobacterium sp.]
MVVNIYRLGIVKTAFFLCLLLGAGYTAKSQDILKSKDLTTLKVDALSDEEIGKIKEQLAQSGLTDLQAEEFFLQKGLPLIEAQKLQARLAGKKTKPHFSNSTKNASRTTDTSSLKYGDGEPFKSNVFGSELFTNNKLFFEPDLRIATPKNYAIGPDDELVIDVFGYQEANYRLQVSAEGTINIPLIGVISVNGLTVEQASKRIKDKLQQNGYANIATGKTQVQISIGKIRTINVTVIGEARKPGTYSISSLSTVFNALYLAAGPTDKGSFREIEVVRNSKVLVKLDAYDFLLKGDQSKNVHLMDQDVIRIPVAKVQVSLSGEVKREGVFEVLPTNSLQELIDFAGGFTSEAYTASIQIKQVTDKERRVKDLPKDEFLNYIPTKGDSVFVGKILNRYTNSVNIKGAIYRPGTYELSSGLTLSKLIAKADGLKDEAFKNRGLIIRTNELDLTKKVLPFSVQNIINKTDIDIVLQKDDQVIIGAADVYKQNYTLQLLGEVKKPGIFNYVEGITLKDLLFLAEGFTDASAIDKIEIARRYASDSVTNVNNIAVIVDATSEKNLSTIGTDIQLNPWDIVSVRKKPNYQEQISVKILGEVKYPGDYALTTKNERVSNLIARSGGLTNFAFTEAASLTRINKVELRRLNQDNLKKLQKDVNDSTTTSNKFTTDIFKPTIKVGLNLQEILNKSGGIDDVVLQEGDVLNIPKQQREVKVNGEVMVPSEVVYKQDANLSYYINKAGGFTDNAREQRVYVIYPNGSAARIKKFLFFKTNPKVTAGSEILVPQIPERKKAGLSTTEIIGLTSAVASLTGVVIAILRF